MIAMEHELDKFQMAMLNMIREKHPKMAKRFLRKIAREVLKSARKRTKKGPTGNLKKGWKLGRSYQRGSSYWIVVKNIMPHAHLIEFGHRKVLTARFRDKKFRTRDKDKDTGFVPGQHILEKSMKEMDSRFVPEAEAFITKMIREAGL